ncbi:MAG TPA: TolC family protein [Terriglobia bacterium]|nr:TolC family protein [Terriglobia bacterium]
MQHACKCMFLLAVLMIVAATAYAQPAATTLSLDNVVNTYIEKNLELQAAKYRLEWTQVDQIAARLRPNPGFTFSAENLGFSGPTPTSEIYQLTATYSETIELGGKRQLREKAADASLSVAQAQFADTLRRGVAAVKRLYFDALLARYDLEVANENQQTFQQLVQFNLARFQQGAIPEADLIKVRLERIKVDSAIKEAQLHYRQAVIRVLEQIGESAFPSNQGVRGDLNVSLVKPDLEVLRQAALNQRPDVQVADRDVEAAEARLALEQGRSHTDLIPYAGYRRLGSDNTIVAGISIPLKTRDKNQAGIARAESEVKIAQKRAEIVKNRVLAEVEAAYEAYQTSRQQLETFRNELLNQADESRSIALAAYEQGATELLPVLEAQRTRADVRREYFRTLFNCQTSLIELTLAVGQEIQ